MPSIIACCRDALAVAGWLAGALSGSDVAGQPGHEMPEVIWRVPGEGRGTPALYRQTAFFLSKHHELYAVDAQSGRVKWRRETHGEGPTTAGTSVVVTPTIVIAGDDGLVAFSHDGAERWRFTAERGHPGVYLGALIGDVVLAGSSIGRLWAVDSRSGSVRWSLDVNDHKNSATVFAPIVTDGLVIAAFTAFDDLRGGGLIAADLGTGRQVWRRSGRFAGGPVGAGALVVTAAVDGTIHAFDRRTGAPRWSLRAPGSGHTERHEFRTLALAGRLLIAGSLTGVVTAYDLTRREQRWQRTPMSASIVFGIATDGQTIYVPHLSGRLVALRAGDGTERWRTGADTLGFSWKPLVVAGRLLAASSSAGLFAFRL